MSNENFFNKAVKTLFLLLITIISIAVLGYSIYCYICADRIGIKSGTELGQIAGRFTGSLEGITEGVKEGKEQGKEEGLSANDTTVNISNRIEKVGKLEVLSASVVLHDVLSASDSYKTLLVFYGNIVFTVDLEKAEFDFNDNSKSLNIILPLPEARVELDDTKSRQLDTYMKHSWTGNNEDGYIAAMNSIKNMEIKAEEKVNNYEYLMELAKESARKQVKFLVESAAIDEVIVNVEFRGKDEETSE